MSTEGFPPGSDISRTKKSVDRSMPEGREATGRSPSYFLKSSVFVSGMAALGIEMAASRLLGNVFGTSNLVWANIIGLILIYLAAGYFLGGRWADRSPHARTFYYVMAWAALSTGAIPVLSHPVLQWAASAVEQLDAAVVIGSFLSVLVLFSVPVTLLGVLSPFAVRLAIREVAAAGNASGLLYAISTVGSIFGTFLPVLVLIPWIGTARTFYLFAGALLLMALAGLFREKRRTGFQALWMLPVLFGLYILGTSGPIKSSTGQIFEKESAYNYIQVQQTAAGVRYLRLNEGEGIHSMYDAHALLTKGAWDYFLAAPFFHTAPRETSDVRSLAIVGLAAGTAARQYTGVFGPIPIEGYEIDPAILAVGRDYFDMNEPNLTALAVDGRWGLEHSARTFSVIAVDAYRPPYIPPHLVTREFFEMARSRLTPDGVLTINVAGLPDDNRLLEALAATVRTVFPSVYVVDVPGTINCILYATVQPVTPSDFKANRDYFAAQPNASPELKSVLDSAVSRLRPAPEGGPVFTDDWAPIEQITNMMMIRFVLSGHLNELQP
jgi:spermidine synthase